MRCDVPASAAASCDCCAFTLPNYLKVRRRRRIHSFALFLFIVWTHLCSPRRSRNIMQITNENHAKNMLFDNRWLCVFNLCVTCVRMRENTNELTHRLIACIASFSASIERHEHEKMFCTCVLCRWCYSKIFQQQRDLAGNNNRPHKHIA